MIDLHLHLDGSLSREDLALLAAMSGIDPEEILSSRLSVDSSCTSLLDYLECFEAPLRVLQRMDTVEEAVYRLLKRLSANDILYAEIRFAPQLSQKEGLSQKQVVEAALRGKKRAEGECGIESNLILCLMRGDQNQTENRETVEVAAEFLGKGVCAIDLAGAEGLYKTKTFSQEFAYARSLNVPFTIHAGESDGASSVRDAVEFGASRIGHGVHAVEDPALLRLIAKKKIALEICPTSEVDTHCVSSIEALPLREFLSAGVPFFINTDDMTVSNVTLKGEYENVQKAFSFDAKTMRAILLNAVEASYASPKTKNRLRAILATKESL